MRDHGLIMCVSDFF